MGGKRRNRQPDANMHEASEDSSESGDKTNSGDSCPHVAKALVKSKLSNCFKKSALDEECAVCKKLGYNETPSPDQEESSPPSLWICLRCGHQACGREQKSHALEHFKSTTHGIHCLAANTQRWDVWCYLCDAEVTGRCRSLLLKVVEISKKKGFLSSPVSQQPIPLPFMQTDVENENIDESNLPLNDLTRVVGLTNLGNTCFFNAVLQCLSQTPFLVKVLEDLQEPGEKFVLPGGKCKSSDDSEEIELPPIEGTLEGWGAFTSILCKTLKTMQSMKTRQNYVPLELLTSFKKKTMQCMDGGQHDSHELLRHLLELVRNEDLRRYQTVILKQIGIGVSIKPNCANDMHKAQVKFWGRQASARLLGPELVFRGVLVSTLKCLECNHSSQRTEPFLDLSLPVMAEKPQPPVLKRKNKVFDDTFDSMGNNISSAASMKNQFKKEEKHVEKTKKQFRLRGQERGSNYYGPMSNANRISEERQQAVNIESESDADVEDNVSAPEIIESGYSSEKVSALTSPVTPDDRDMSKNSIGQNDSSVTSINGNLSSSTVNIDAESTRHVCDDLSTNGESNGPIRPVNVSINLNKLVLETSDSNWAESPMITEATSEIGDYVGISPSTSLIVNSELSTEGATISPLSSPVMSKDSPTSPPSSSANDDNKTSMLDETNSRQFLGAEARSPGWDLFENAADEKMQAETNELRLLIENPSRKMVLADRETPEYRTTEDHDDEPTTSPVEQPEVKSENGVTDITVGLSKVTVSSSNHQSNCYQLKDGDCSIQSCLNQFTALELMSGSNKVGCEACTARENKGKEGPTKMICTPSTKQYLISRVPAVLILHLKRFQSLRTSFRKVAKSVTFPLLLDLAPVCKGGAKPKVYSLYGVVEHLGTLHGGHYVAYVKTRPPLTPDDPRWAFLPSKDNKESAENSSASSSDSETDEAKANFNVKPPPGHWYHVSDSRLMEVDEATVLRTQAYILFYERIL